MDNINSVLDDKAKDLFKGKHIPTFPPTQNSELDEDSLNLNPLTLGNTRESIEEKVSEKDVDLDEVKKSILCIKDQLDSLLRIVGGEKVRKMVGDQPETSVFDSGERIVEGVFTGEKMIGQDGEEYSVPPNYASKSKLVEGDIMKLTITNRGSFIYKQIQQVNRKRVTGELVSDENGNWSVIFGGRPYKILTASATFYKGNAGDDVVILIPETGESSWGAVENIIHKA
ncbi:MAG: hypothetical protein ABII02_03565 [Candidatus Magasanikbacteria bacterium]